MTVEQARALIEAKRNNPSDKTITFQMLQQAIAVISLTPLKAR